MLMKIVYKDVVHRHQVDDFKSFTYDDLLKTVRSLTGLDGPLTIQYTDNEMECITIGSSAELIDAFEMAEQDGRTALRVFVCPVSGPGPLSVITTTSENSAVMLPTSTRVAGEESDFGDSDFEFVEEDGDLQARITERPTNPSAENIVVQAAANGSESFFTDSVETNKCKIAPPTLVPVTLSEAAVQLSEATTATPDTLTQHMEALTIQEQTAPQVPVFVPETTALVVPGSEPSSVQPTLDESKVNEIAEQVFREVAETKVKQLTDALAVIFDNEPQSESSDLGDVPLRKAVAAVFSKEDAVAVIQKALSDPLIKSMVLDMCAAECDDKSIWEACSPHMVKALELSSTVLKECPQLFTLIPPIVAASMRLLNAKKAESDGREAPRPAPPKADSVVHKRVQCNGCLEKDPRMTSYIVGARFKSAITEDFDLCEACEADGKYNQKHGPFLKIYTPSQAPEALFCVIRGSEPSESMKKEERAFRDLAKKVKDANPSETHTFKEVVVEIPKRHGQVNTGDFTDMMAAHVDAATQAAAAVDDEVTQSPGESFAEYVAKQVRETSAAAVADASMASLENTAPVNVTSSNGCPGKHLLKRFLTPHVGFVCDKCGARPGTYDVMFGCRICNFDVCSACYKGKAPAVDPPATPAGYTASAEGGNTLRVVQKPQAKFVADISLPDGSVVSPGSKLSKTWRLRNTGTVTWPKGTRIVHVGGDSLGLSTQTAIDAVDPGHVVDITVPLTAPSRPGRVVGYFRLMTPDNQRFGHRIWVDVTVDGTLGEQIAATVAKPFIEIGQDIVSRVQEETMKLYPRVPPSASSGESSHASSTESASAATPSEAAPVPKASEVDERIKKYEIELTTLCDMGFMDVQRNTELLAAANGDLETVIGQLMGSA